MNGGAEKAVNAQGQSGAKIVLLLTSVCSPRISPVRIFIVVVLPAPLIPRYPKHSPTLTPKVICFTATLGWVLNPPA